MSTSPDSARPGTAAVAARRPRRAIIALAVAGALTGGGLIAAAPHASAAPAAAATVKTATSKPVPSTKITVSKRTVVKNDGSTRPKFTMVAKRSGKAISARAKLIINGKTITTRTMHGGKISFQPYKKRYKVGTNKVRVVVIPKSSKLAAKSSPTVSVKGVKKETRSQKIVRVAKAQVGDRYVYGASGPNSFDCSGLTKYVYKKATGKTLPRSSSAQKSHGKAVSRKNARPGDLIWTPGHVAIYIGNGKQVEAARPGVGVVKRHIWQDNPRFIRI